MLSVAHSAWLIPALVLIVLSGVVLWSSFRAARGRLKRAAVVLKFAALCLLAVCLIEPVWSGTHPRPHSNLFVVLVDNSRSLTTGSGSNDTSGETLPADSLAAQIESAVQPQPGNWLEQLGQDFELHPLIFDRRLRAVTQFKELNWDGDASALHAALQGIQQRYAGRPLGGVLLFTDGNSTDAGTPLESKGLPPVFPVTFTKQSQDFDLAIEAVSVSETPFEDAPVSLQCDVALRGLQTDGRDLMAVCQLKSLDGKILKTERQAVTDDSRRLTFRMQHRPAQGGLEFARLEVEVVSLKARDDDVVFEQTRENNARLVQFRNGRTKQRVLYLCGRPNWEFKFLRRAVEEDSQVDLVGMIRVAKKEAKFDFRGRDGQSSNSLFRGFKSETDEETERYDEPVLVRLNTKDAEELRGGFPKAADELFVFDAIILDDIEAGFFTRDQLTLLQRFVSERGGGLLMLGGQESFQDGDYARTPVADVLPVYLDRTAFPPEDSRLALDLTREGWLQPFIRLRSTEDEERQRLGEMVGFKTLNPVEGIKPGASVLATVRDEAGRHWPAFVAQTYGRGRAASLLIGDLWRWQISPEEGHTEDCAKAWRQMIRWLIADVPGRIDLRTEPALEISPEAVRVVARAVDREYRPIDNARLQIHVEPAGVVASDSTKDASTALVLDAEASLTEPGTWSVVFVPKEAGAWKLHAEAAAGEGEKLGSEPSGWIAQPQVHEFQKIGQDRERLTQLAQQSGGHLVEADELDAFVRSLQRRTMPVMEAWSLPLWDQPLVLMLVFGMLGGEWWLRRSRGLP